MHFDCLRWWVTREGLHWAWGKTLRIQSLPTSPALGLVQGSPPLLPSPLLGSWVPYWRQCLSPKAITCLIFRELAGQRNGCSSNSETTGEQLQAPSLSTSHSQWDREGQGGEKNIWHSLRYEWTSQFGLEGLGLPSLTWRGVAGYPPGDGSINNVVTSLWMKRCLEDLDTECPSAWPLSCPWKQCIPASRRGP